MIYTICLLLFLAAIIFFHYLEGLFSATLSAIFAIIAAVVAVGYHEVIVESLLGGRFASESHGLVLMVLFAVTYLFLRLIFDQLIKGNVRFPVMVDKIGASVMGLIAGIFALGVMTIAVQEFPFGPDIAGYHRYAIADRTLPQMKVPGFNNMQIATNSAELTSDEVGSFDSTQKNHLFPAVDDAVVNTVSWLSSGSLAGSQPLGDIHPDLIQELFGQRIGIEAGANHSALNLASGPHQVSVLGIYTVPSTDLTVLDQYDPKMRDHPLDAIGVIANLDKGAKGSTIEADKMLLVVRTQFSADLADANNFRFSPGTIRLVAPQTIGTTEQGDYYPIGTLENNTLYIDKPDDYLFLNLSGGDRVVDLVFMVDRWKDAQQKTVKQMPSLSFLEVKRLARVDLEGKPIDTKAPDTKLAIGVAHVSTGPSAAVVPPPPGRPVPPPAPAPAPPTGTPQPAPTPGQPYPQPQPRPQPSNNPMSPHSIVPGGPSSVLDIGEVIVSSALPQKLGTSAAEAAKKRGTAIAGGTADLRDGSARSLALDASELATDAEKGDVAITDLAPPKGQTFIRITTKPGGGDNTWGWAPQVNKLAVVDGGGTAYAPQGLWAAITIGGAEHILAQYSEGYNLDEITPGDGTVTSIVLYIPVPTGAQLRSVTLDGKQIKDLSGMDTSH
jgi:hypothetical protein